MRIVVFILFLTTLGYSSISQQKFELRLGAGYSFSTGSGYKLDNTGYGNGNPNSVDGSFGGGVSLNADATWWLNSVFGVSAGGSFNTTAPDVKGHYLVDLMAVDNYSRSDFSWHANTGLAMAGIALRIPHVKLNPYARMGVLLPVYSSLKEDATWTNTTIAGTTGGDYKRTFKLGNTPGYSASMGIAPQLNKHLALFAEVNIQALSILARRATLTSYVVRGTETINMYNANFKETIYEKNPAPPYTNDPNQPSHQTTFSFPYNSIGLHIGVSIKL
jgi:hypothetical protein